MKNFFYSHYKASEKIDHGKRKTGRSFAWFPKTVGMAVLISLTITGLRAQTVSGTWDAANTTGATGYTNRGNGVIQLLDLNSNGCQGSAVHETSVKYDPTTTFNKCYQVFFGCPGNDNIGTNTDKNGDGMAFSFTKGTCAYNINNGACGGGLGYNGACPEMITIEFDTYSSMGTSNFDGSYGGGTSGDNDEIAVHWGGVALDANRLTSVNAGNLEDGLEHTICISYNPTTHILGVSIDGASKLAYNLGATYNLSTYFGAGAMLNQTWSSGKFGATNPATVSDGVTSPSIAAQLGGAPLCPASVAITSPANGTGFDICDGPVAITATSTPPASNTVDYIEFFVDGTSIGTDASSPYNTTWVNPTSGDHSITAVAHYTPSNTTSTSSPATDITIGGGIQKTATAPTIDGAVDPIWGNYTASALTQRPVGAAPANAADLSATFKTMRDATNLYILIDVNDSDLRDGFGNPWENDGAEVFIDMGNNKSATYGADDYQYAFVYSGGASEYKHSPLSMVGVTMGHTLKAGGYILEIQLPWLTLGHAPADGELIGFDVHVNDNDGGGTRETKIAWYDAVDVAFNSPAGFGTIKASACDPCPTGVLSGNKVVCDALTTSPLSVSFTGIGPWSFTYSIDGVTQPAVTGVSASPYVFQSGTGTHTYALVSVSNAITTGCTGNATGTASISVSTNIPVGHDASFTPPATAMLSVDNTGGTYQWYDAAVGGNLVYTGPVFTTPVLTNTTIYYVQEALGAPCRTEVKAISVPVTGIFFIPNLMTPNSDGKNDLFEITALPSGSALEIVNRWGDRVYNSSDYDNLWTGGNASDGVYYYHLQLPDGKQFKGWLNIIR